MWTRLEVENQFERAGKHAFASSNSFWDENFVYMKFAVLSNCLCFVLGANDQSVHEIIDLAMTMSSGLPLKYKSIVSPLEEKMKVGSGFSQPVCPPFFLFSPKKHVYSFLYFFEYHLYLHNILFRNGKHSQRERITYCNLIYFASSNLLQLRKRI